MSLVGLRLAMASGGRGNPETETQALLWRMRSGLDTTTIVDEVVYDGASAAPYAFLGIKTRSLVLPNIATIPHGMGLSMRYLTSVSAPNATSWSNNSFDTCTSLVHINLPNLAGGLGTLTLSGCTSLTHVSFPNITTGGDRSFSGCTKLLEVSIPLYTGKFGNGVFQNCTSLQVIDIRSGTAMATFSPTTFTNVPKSCKVVVPDGLLAQYRADAQWTASGLNIVGATEYENI